MSILIGILTGIGILLGLVLVVVVALQTEKNEGLGSLLAGGGGGGGKVGREKGLDKTGLVVCYSWLIITALLGWLRHKFG